MAALVLRLPTGARVAAVASGAMIAQQVAGKAARDALFLSNFSVKALPLVMGLSAVASLFVTLWFSRMMLRLTPVKVVPAGFAASAAALLGEWALSSVAPKAAAIALYLHTALFGAAMISAFWSLINETFDPHTGKRAVNWIAGGGTLGGVLGGIAAWRASALIEVPTMLPLLAGANVICFWGSMRLRELNSRGPAAESADAAVTVETSPLRTLRDVPYLRHLTVIVALGAVTSGLLDYVFSAEVAKVYAKGSALMSFFALFWLAVGILSFVVQALLGRLALDRLGLGVTVALLPAVVVVGGAVGLAVPGLFSTALLRGAEATQRSSLFRAAYELLYTPLSEEKRRSTKTLIDVGSDRIGTLAAAAIAAATLAIDPRQSETALIVIGVVCAMISLVRSRPLHMGYVAMLEESLRKEAAKLEPPVSRRSIPPDERAELRDKIIERLDVLPHAAELAAIASGDSTPVPDPPGATTSVQGRASEIIDTSLKDIADMWSGDPRRVQRVLSTGALLAPPLVSFAIMLLADARFHREAIQALRKGAARDSGQLIDALCDPSVDFDIRRRIPRILSVCATQRVANGLVTGTEDERFEVRYECGRALLKITSGGAPIVISLETVIAMVNREVSISKEVWESQPLPQFDEDEDPAPALIDRLLRDRIDRSMEHVFTLLALHLDRESIHTAFKALHSDDPRLRGTALEYLETVLPDEIRDAVWPFIGEERPMRTAREPKDILADLKGAPDASDPALALKATI
jgi:ATP:ADP antiporter, AAA family